MVDGPVLVILSDQANQRLVEHSREESAMLQIASMPFPGSPPLRIAVIDAPLDNDLVRRLIDLEVDGVELLRESAPHGNSHAQGLEWLTEASTVQHVTIDWATAPSIPRPR